jgi:transposase-like protein
MANGATHAEVAKKLGISPVTLTRWYGGLRIDQAKKLKDLEKENQRLKRLLADAEIDKSILKEALKGNY